MARADDLTLRIGGNTAGFRAALNGVRTTSGLVGRGVVTAFGAAERSSIGLARSLFSVQGALAALGAGLSLREIRQTLSEISDLNSEASTAGIDVETFQELKYAAEQSEIGIEALTDGIKEMQLRADEFAITGKGSAAEAFERIGISAREASDMLADPAKMFETILDRMKDFDKASQIRLADEIFGGTGGEQFVRFLADGTKGVDELRRRARELGIVLDTDVVKSAQEMDRKFAEITASMSAKWKSMVVGITTSLHDWLNPDTADLVARKMEEIATVQAEIAAIKAGEGGLIDWINKPFGNGIEQKKEELAALRRELAMLSEQLRGEAESGSMDALGDGKPDRTFGGTTSDAEDAEKRAKKIREVTEALIREWQALGQTNEQKRIAQELSRAGVDISSAEGQSIADLVRIIEAERRVREARAQVMEDANQRARNERESIRHIGQEFENTALSIVDGSAKAEDALKRLALQFALAAAKAALLGEGPLAGLFGPATLPGGSISPQVASLVASGAGGLFAKGGVANRPSIFAEAGPEAAVPLPDGRRIPVDLRGMDRQPAGNTIVNVNAPPGDKVSTQESFSGNDRILDVLIERVGDEFGLGRPPSAY